MVCLLLQIGKSPYFQISADCTLKKGKFLIEGTAAGGEKQSFSPILAQPSTGDERKAKVLRDVVQVRQLDNYAFSALLTLITYSSVIYLKSGQARPVLCNTKFSRCSATAPAC